MSGGIVSGGIVSGGIVSGGIVVHGTVGVAVPPPRSPAALLHDREVVDRERAVERRARCID
ncbi:MAG: hypothetical protein ACYCR4_03990, partial [Acidimicrobiales bacterium]